MAQQNYRVKNDLGMWLRSATVVDEASKIILLSHGQLVTKIADTDNPEWWQVSAKVHDEDQTGFCKHALMVPDADFQPAPGANKIIAVDLKRTAPVTRNQQGTEAFMLNEQPHPSRDPNAATSEKVTALGEIISWLAVSTSLRYKKTTDTFCNIYAYDYCRLAGVFMPRVWWTKEAIAKLQAGEVVSPVYGKTIDEVTANQLAQDEPVNWFRNFGYLFGWRRTNDLTELQRAANNGQVCLINAAKHPGHGHICAVAPETAEHTAQWNPAHDQVMRPLLSQAGSLNFEYRPYVWWGPAYTNLGFWIHDD